MLMLEDLKKRPILISSLEISLHNKNYASVIPNDKNSTSFVLDKKVVNDCFSAFKSCDISLVGASHGIVISPLFALTVSENKKTAYLKMYLSLPDENLNILTKKHIQNDIGMLAIAVSFFYPEIVQIKSPFVIDDLITNEFEIKSSYEDSLINILR